jgi:hypothetical protein
MAALSLPTFHYQTTMNISLGAIDAELALYHQLSRDSGTTFSRFENIPGRLVAYIVSIFTPEREYGESGRIFIQFLEENKTRLSFEVAEVDKYGAARFASDALIKMFGGLDPERLRPDEFERGASILFELRFQALKEICENIQSRLEPLAGPSPAEPFVPPSEKAPGGRPTLDEEELVRRLALVLLERRVKKRVPGLSRNNFAAIVWRKLKLPVEAHTIKNTVSKLKEIEREGPQHLLEKAEKQADEWQALLL